MITQVLPKEQNITGQQEERVTSDGMVGVKTERKSQKPEAES